MARTTPPHARRRSRTATARTAARPATARTAPRSATALTAAVLTLCAAVAVPAAAVSAPAGDTPPAGSGVEVTPSRAKPGDRVDLRVRFCAKGESALAASDAFTRDIELSPAAGGELVGTAHIRPRAEPGSYGITVDCRIVIDTGSGKGSVTVVGGGGGQHRPTAPASPGTPESPAAPAAPVAPASPVAPVRAGGGGTAEESTGGGSALPRTAGLALAGGALLLGAVGFAVRRRRAADATGRR